MYPGPLRKSTPVCHFFTKEWEKEGNQVIVIHFRSIFPRFYYIASQIFRKWAIKVNGNDNVEKDYDPRTHVYEYDGILVYSIAIYKFIPHGKYSKNTLSRKILEIKEILKDNKFTPDAIIGHFYNPTIPVINKLSEFYPKARTSIVFHEADAGVISKAFGNSSQKRLLQFDVIGGRSESIRKSITDLYSVQDSFVCYSGIPESFVSPDNQIDCATLSHICFVGQLLDNKKPVETFIAVNNAFKDTNYTFNVVGKGPLLEQLIITSKQLNAEANLNYRGFVSRNEVQNIIESSDIFVLVSEQEAFGLVYLEAMAKGCITIGTRGQGIDGVIIDGYNGFLCESGNIEELTDVLMKIRRLPEDQVKQISHNAILTAQKFSDKNVADYYLDKVFGNQNLIFEHE